MIELGIFTKTFDRQDVESVFDAVRALGLNHVQFNFSSANLPSIPKEIPAEIVDHIRRTATDRRIVIDAISATFNMIHPDTRVVKRGMQGLEALAQTSAGLDCSLLTLCTGTFDPDSMWREHPGNGSEEAWDALLASMGRAIEIAEKHDMTLGIEPEPANVVSDCTRAKRLLDELKSDRVGVIFDPANIIEQVQEDAIDDVIITAFDQIGDRIVSAHGKDRDRDGQVVPAGTGAVPWETVLEGLDDGGYQGPLLLHGLEESNVAESVRYFDEIFKTSANANRL